MKKESLGELIIKSEDELYHIAKGLLQKDEDCADAVQSAIVNAFSKIHTLRNDDYAKTWLIRILINDCYRILRRRKKVIALDEYIINRESTEENDYSDLYDAVSHLPEKERLSVILHYVEGYSIKEIAKILRTTESAIKNRMLRARKKLREELKREA